MATRLEIELQMEALRGKIEKNQERLDNSQTCTSAKSLLRLTLGEDGRRLIELENELKQISETEGNVVASAA